MRSTLRKEIDAQLRKVEAVLLSDYDDSCKRRLTTSGKSALQQVPQECPLTEALIPGPKSTGSTSGFTSTAAHGTYAP